MSTALGLLLSGTVLDEGDAAVSISGLSGPVKTLLPDHAGPAILSNGCRRP